MCSSGVSIPAVMTRCSASGIPGPLSLTASSTRPVSGWVETLTSTSGWSLSLCSIAFSMRLATAARISVSPRIDAA